MSQSLDRLFRPNSIAVVGGGAWCANVVEQCLKAGFEGPIWPVHPKKSEIHGQSAFADLSELPGPPDATFIGVNRHLTVEIAEKLSKMGAGGAVCFAAGFAEAEAEDNDAPQLQANLLTAAGDMPILGPNCYGFINYLDGALLWPDQHGGIAQERGVAIVTQSSNIAINMTMQARGLPLAYVATAGNQAQQGLSDIGLALARDPRVTAIGLHIEGVGDLPALERLAREAESLGKPVVALKVGRSAAAQAATVSHTASLAGSDAGAQALFDRLGIARVGDVASFLETLKLAHVTGPLRSNQIVSASCSGGEASLIADLAEPLGLEFPALNETQSNELRAALGPLVRLANPLDYNTYIWPNPDKMAATFTGLMQAELALGIVILDFPRSDRCSDADWAHVVDAVERTMLRTGQPMAIMASLAETLPEHWANAMIARGIAPLNGMSEGLAAIAALAEQSSVASSDLALPAVVADTRVLDEGESKTLLATTQIPLPKRRLAESPDEAMDAALDIGFPVVLKTRGLAHKSDNGGLALNLGNADAVRDAAVSMPSEQFLIEEMVDGGVAELIIGVTDDGAHGKLLTIGAGGVLTEILRDTAHLLLPATREDIGNALRRLKIFPVLEGYRGNKAADIEAIIDAIMALCDFVLGHRPRIVEAEINPLIVRQSGVVAVDALITMETDT